MKQINDLILSELPRTFTSKQFAILLLTRTTHLHPNHTLHEMSKRGYIRRLGEGRFRIV